MEQYLDAEAVDARADLFSVGVVLFEAVCGQRLFSEETFGEHLRAAHVGDRPDPLALRPELPERMAAALAIHREAGDRGGEGYVLANLGDLYRSQDRLQEAQASYRAVLEIQRALGNRHREVHVLVSLGELSLRQGRRAVRGRSRRDRPGTPSAPGAGPCPRSRPRTT